MSARQELIRYVRAAIVQSAKSDTQIARETGAQQSSVSRWHKGQSLISTRFLADFAVSTGCDYETLRSLVEAAAKVPSPQEIARGIQVELSEIEDLKSRFANLERRVESLEARRQR